MAHHIQLTNFHICIQSEDTIVFRLVIFSRLFFGWNCCFLHRSWLCRGFNLLLLRCRYLLLNNRLLNDRFLLNWCRLSWLCLNNRLFNWLVNFFFHLDLHFFWRCRWLNFSWLHLCLLSRFIKFVKVYLANRFKLLFRLFRCRLIALYGHSWFHLVFIFLFPSENELVRLNLQVLVGTKLLPEQIKLLIGNFGVRVFIHLKSLLFQEFHGGADTNVQISCYFI